MKKVFLKSLAVAASLVVLASCGNSKKGNGFELKGTLTNASGEKLVLEQMAGNSPVFIDSAIVNEKGEFEFTNVKATPLDFFRIKTSEANFAIIVADSTHKMVFTGDAKNLGKDYIVWDKAACIKFKKPGLKTVSATFEISKEKIAEIKSYVDSNGKGDFTFFTTVNGENGEIVAEVEKVLYVRYKHFKKE